MQPIRRIPFAVATLMIAANFAAAQDDTAQYVTPEDVPVQQLEVREAFDGLSDDEKRYAHWMTEASWRGALICFEQLSPESPVILELFQRIFTLNRVELRKAANWHGVTDVEIEWLMQYAARFYSNCGNYLSFGDTKFIPRIAPEKMGLFVQAAAALAGDEEILDLWSDASGPMYSLEADEHALGLGDEGISNYYSENVTRKDVDVVAAFMKERGMEAWNSRLFKDDDGTLRIVMASALRQPSQSYRFDGREIVIEYGDHADALANVVECLGRALPFCANDNQRRMILAYIAHFNGGDIDDHKTSQRWWVKDKGPVVETNIGFIETYRDPMAVRAEWEGLVSVVNKEQTKKFGILVDSAPRLIALLPWGKGFEKDKFLRPDFTSLEVVCFANGGIPAGINIPNYDEIRQVDGFKNVSLGNVLRARGGSTEKIKFIAEDLQELYRENLDESFEVQVGLHELLGHGSGKLLEKRADGSFNFDRNAVKDPFTGKPVVSWYEPGETWGSKFTTIASSYEECRAEAVGLHLCNNDDVLKVFGHEGQKAADVAYVNWLSMARAGVLGLVLYDPDRKAWRQAHSQARFALMQVMERAGGGLLKIEKTTDGEWIVKLDRSKIKSVGAPAIADFLTRLNVYKATANAEAGRAMYLDHTKVDGKYLEIRDWIMANRKPRHIWVQPVTDIDVDGNVILREYPATNEGVVDSFVDRYGN